MVIFGAGAGMPYFSTDTVAAQRALEIHADVVLMSKNGVDGVYTADPRTDPARAQARHDHASPRRCAAGCGWPTRPRSACAMDNGLPMLVFAPQGDDTIVRAVGGEKIGTLITPPERLDRSP